MINALPSGPRIALVEAGYAAAEVEKMQSHNFARFILGSKVQKKAEELLEHYGMYLSMQLRTEASKLCWGMNRTPKEYEKYFLSCVLMRAYRPFDATHKNYFRILEAIRKYNPEWEKSFVSRHDDWVRMLQDRKVPIYIGTQ